MPSMRVPLTRPTAPKASALTPRPGGGLKSARAKIGGICSQAMSAFQLIRHGKAGEASMGWSEAMSALGRCRSQAYHAGRAQRHREAGREALAQAIEHRVRTGRTVARERLEQAKALRAQRMERIKANSQNTTPAAAVTPAATGPRGKTAESFTARLDRAHARATRIAESLQNRWDSLPFDQRKEGMQSGTSTLFGRHAIAEKRRVRLKDLAIETRGSAFRKEVAESLRTIRSAPLEVVAQKVGGTVNTVASGAINSGEGIRIQSSSTSAPQVLTRKELASKTLKTYKFFRDKAREQNTKYQLEKSKTPLPMPFVLPLRNTAGEPFVVRLNKAYHHAQTISAALKRKADTTARPIKEPKPVPGGKLTIHQRAEAAIDRTNRLRDVAIETRGSAVRKEWADRLRTIRSGPLDVAAKAAGGVVNKYPGRGINAGEGIAVRTSSGYWNVQTPREAAAAMFHGYRDLQRRAHDRNIERRTHAIRKNATLIRARHGF